MYFSVFLWNKKSYRRILLEEDKCFTESEEKKYLKYLKLICFCKESKLNNVYTVCYFTTVYLLQINHWRNVLRILLEKFGARNGLRYIYTIHLLIRSIYVFLWKRHSKGKNRCIKTFTKVKFSQNYVSLFMYFFHRSYKIE